MLSLYTDILRLVIKKLSDIDRTYFLSTCKTLTKLKDSEYILSSVSLNKLINVPNKSIFTNLLCNRFGLHYLDQFPNVKHLHFKFEDCDRINLHFVQQNITSNLTSLNFDYNYHPVFDYVILPNTIKKLSFGSTFSCDSSFKDFLPNGLEELVLMDMTNRRMTADDYPPNLKVLYIDSRAFDSQIKSNYFPPNLSTLKIYGQIKKIEQFSIPSNLSELRIYTVDNVFEHLPTSLIKLKINNFLAYVDQGKLYPKLKTLNLKYNIFPDIINFLECLPALSSIYFSNIYFTTSHKDILHNLSNKIKKIGLDSTAYYIKILVPVETLQLRNYKNYDNHTSCDFSPHTTKLILNTVRQNIQIPYHIIILKIKDIDQHIILTIPNTVQKLFIRRTNLNCILHSEPTQIFFIENIKK